MPQSPLLVDQVQIEPGSGQTLLLNRNAADGSLKFTDNVLPTGILLYQLAGMRNVTGVYIVGTGGTGAAYTSIQDALDAIPLTSSPSAPALVLVLPGLYTENLTVQRDGVAIVGLGGVNIVNSGASDTVTVSATSGATPENVLLRGLTITNDQSGYACVKVDGADTFASGTATIIAAPLAIGDTLTVGGLPLTGVCGFRTPGANDFNIASLTTAALAVEIAAAINDPANAFAALVTATVVGSTITLSAVNPGAGGNAITLAAATTPAGNITVSGATFTGGGSAGTSVALGELLIEGCALVASAAGGYNLYADTVNHLRVQGGTFRGSSSTASVQVLNCAALRVFGVEQVVDVGLSYDTSADQPADLSCAYLLSGCGEVGDVLCNLLGAGTLTVLNCPQVGDVSVAGDQTFLAVNSALGALTLSDTVAATLQQTTRTTATVASGTPTLAETMRSGFVSFLLSSSETVTLDVPQPDTNYVVLLDVPSVFTTAAVTSRTTASFVVDTSVACTGDINYAVVRQLP